MPCYDPGPSDRELQTEKTCKLYLWLTGSLGMSAPDAYKVAALDGYGNANLLDRVTNDLCTLLQRLDDEVIERVVYDAHNKYARDMATWWEEHQEQDEKRLRLELNAINERLDKEALLSRLTPYEKKLLKIRE